MKELKPALAHVLTVANIQLKSLRGQPNTEIKFTIQGTIDQLKLNHNYSLTAKTKVPGGPGLNSQTCRWFLLRNKPELIHSNIVGPDNQGYYTVSILLKIQSHSLPPVFTAPDKILKRIIELDPPIPADISPLMGVKITGEHFDNYTSIEISFKSKI